MQARRRCMRLCPVIDVQITFLHHVKEKGTHMSDMPLAGMMYSGVVSEQLALSVMPQR